MSATFEKMVRYLSKDAAVTNADLSAALMELEEEFRSCLHAANPIDLERYRLRKVLKAVAHRRGLAGHWSSSG